jgi:hypothetical protein
MRVSSPQCDESVLMRPHEASYSHQNDDEHDLMRLCDENAR